MHINDKELNQYQSNKMGTQDMIAFLEHLDQCNFCLDQFIHHEEQQCNHLTPVYLKEQILARSASPEVQTVKAAGDTSHRLQMFYYSLRTAAGVIAALFLLFSIGQVDFTALRSQPSAQVETTQVRHEQQNDDHLYRLSRSIGSGLSEGTKKLTGYLSDFSNMLLNGGN
ncbi:hypothetical protein NXH76_08675 [Blautia schinkii]|nr:hypothetical protein [Blautia schinkii]